MGLRFLRRSRWLEVIRLKDDSVSVSERVCRSRLLEAERFRSGLDWTELDWAGLDWAELDRTRLDSNARERSDLD